MCVCVCVCVTASFTSYRTFVIIPPLSAFRNINMYYNYVHNYNYNAVGQELSSGRVCVHNYYSARLG